MGSGVATSWSTTYDRLAVIDAEGKLVFKGTRAARSDVNEAKSAVQNALNQVTTSVLELQENAKVSLKQNFPNPAIQKTTIEFNLAESDYVSLQVISLTGKVVKTLVSSELSAGTHSVLFETGDIPNGVYFYRLDAGNFSATNKMLINK